jgi:hypothetical protein
MMINKIVLLLVTFGVLLSTIYVQHVRNLSLKTQNESLIMEISTLKTESKAAVDRANEASRNAVIEMKQSQIDSKAILMAKVPARCRAAMKWGIDQAQVFTS